MPDFPSRLKDLRKSKSVTQKAMSELLDVEENHYQRYEYGKTIPNIVALTKLAEYFNVSTDYLLGLTDKPDRQ